MTPLDQISYRPRRGALTVVAVGCLSLVAACGSGDTQSADSSGSGGGKENKTIAFSPSALKVPVMKDLSEGVKKYGKGKGYSILVQDPNQDAQKQATDLRSVIDSGRVGGAWVITIEPSSLKDVVSTAQDKKVPMILNGTPEQYGFSGMQPGLSFATIDYAREGKILGEEMGNCINEKLGGKAKILWLKPSAGSAGKEEVEKAQLAALKATAPDAEIVTDFEVAERAKAQTDTGNALQGNPDANAVMAANDEGALGALGAFDAAGKKVTCMTEMGGNDEVLQAVKDGKIYASASLQFDKDMVQSFDKLTEMMADPTAEGLQLTVPMKVTRAED